MGIHGFNEPKRLRREDNPYRCNKGKGILSSTWLYCTDKSNDTVEFWSSFLFEF